MARRLTGANLLAALNGWTELRGRWLAYGVDDDFNLGDLSAELAGLDDDEDDGGDLGGGGGSDGGGEEDDGDLDAELEAEIARELGE